MTNPTTAELFVGESKDISTYSVLLEASHVGSRRTNALAETVSRGGSALSAVSTTSANANYTKIQLAAGQIVSKLTVFVIGAATSPTHGFAALYDSSFNKLASSADTLTTAWAANAELQFTLATPYTVPADGIFYVGVACVSGGNPTLAGVAGQAALNTLAPAVAFVDSSNTISTSMPATATKSAGASVLYAYAS